MEFLNLSVDFLSGLMFAVFTTTSACMVFRLLRHAFSSSGESGGCFIIRLLASFGALSVLLTSLWLTRYGYL